MLVTSRADGHTARKKVMFRKGVWDVELILFSASPESALSECYSNSVYPRGKETMPVLVLSLFSIFPQRKLFTIPSKVFFIRALKGGYLNKEKKFI